MGTGVPSTARLCPQTPSANSGRRPVGGQHHIGLFGILGCDRARQADARRQQAKAQAKGPAQSEAPRPQLDDQPSRIAGLTFAQRRQVILSRTDLAVVSLGSYERRPVPAGPTMESLIAARRARRAQAAQDDEPETPKATPAMLAAAHASDMREAFAFYYDDEQADAARRCAGAGYVELTLAMEGN